MLHLTLQEQQRKAASRGVAAEALDHVTRTAKESGLSATMSKEVEDLLARSSPVGKILHCSCKGRLLRENCWAKGEWVQICGSLCTWLEGPCEVLARACFSSQRINWVARVVSLTLCCHAQAKLLLHALLWYSPKQCIISLTTCRPSRSS